VAPGFFFAMNYSSRIPLNLEPSPLAQLVGSPSAQAVDLTITNPTKVGLGHDDLQLSVGIENYRPDARGDRRAREAVAEYILSQGASCEVDNLILTSSTSEAYAYLFKVFCNPGEAVAVPAPSYPLIAHLAELDGVRVLPFTLQWHDGRWCLDIPSLQNALDLGAKAVVIVNPNNPTGSILDSLESSLVQEMCLRANVPLIVDEVFAPFGPQGQRAPSLVRRDGPLTIVCDGLSKAAGLPQLKLAWMSVHGPANEVDETMARLRFVADAYLSVNAPVQQAAAALLELAPAWQARVGLRLATNRAYVAAAASHLAEIDDRSGWGGWFAMLRVPHIVSDEDLVARLCREHHVLVHPGFFYDAPHDGFLVLSLIVAEPTLKLGVSRLIEGLRCLIDEG
jgi:alanine-synthesizing transaminase